MQINKKMEDNLTANLLNKGSSPLYIETIKFHDQELQCDFSSVEKSPFIQNLTNFSNRTMQNKFKHTDSNTFRGIKSSPDKLRDIQS